MKTKTTTSYASKGAERTGEITEAITTPVGSLVQDVLKVAGRSVGEAFGGLGGGIADGYEGCRKAISGPMDPEEYEEWVKKKEERDALRAQRREATQIRKTLAPMKAAMAQMQAMQQAASVLNPGQQIDYDKLAEAIKKQGGNN